MFALDSEVCLMLFYPFQLDLQLAADEGDTASFIPNGEWSLLGENLSFI